MNDRLIVMESKVSGLEASVGSMITRFDNFADELNDWKEHQGKPNWNLVMGFFAILATSGGVLITLVIAVAGALWFLITTQMTNQVNPIKAELATVTEGHRNLDARMESQAIRIGKLEGTDQATGQALREVETQFRASDEIRNIQFANQQRQNQNFQSTLSSLGAKVPNAPDGPYYYPHIAQPPEK